MKSTANSVLLTPELLAHWPVAFRARHRPPRYAMSGWRTPSTRPSRIDSLATPSEGLGKRRGVDGRVSRTSNLQTRCQHTDRVTVGNLGDVVGAEGGRATGDRVVGAHELRAAHEGRFALRRVARARLDRIGIDYCRCAGALTRQVSPLQLVACCSSAFMSALI